MHKPNRDDLEKLSDLYTSGVIKPVIDKIYPLSETATGLQRLGQGKIQGKVVISIANEA
jgi:NADPH:quinone reductase-like Zn-dependent oxidoreductase